MPAPPDARRCCEPIELPLMLALWPVRGAGRSPLVAIAEWVAAEPGQTLSRVGVEGRGPVEPTIRRCSPGSTPARLGQVLGTLLRTRTQMGGDVG